MLKLRLSRPSLTHHTIYSSSTNPCTGVIADPCPASSLRSCWVRSSSQHLSGPLIHAGIKLKLDTLKAQCNQCICKGVSEKLHFIIGNCIHSSPKEVDMKTTHPNSLRSLGHRPQPQVIWSGSVTQGRTPPLIPPLPKFTPLPKGG